MLCFVRARGSLLLIRKRRGLGKGKINAPGGRIEPDETAVEAAVRETREEVGVCPLEPYPVADLSFQFADGYSLHCTVFFADSHRGEPRDTEEAFPFWCAQEEIPFNEMWEDDRHWLPRVLDGDYVSGRFAFDGDSMLTCEMNHRRRDGMHRHLRG